ncbi:MAG: hydrolase, partial [Flavobacterium micromati]|nr:hydrolase [Flavobacterium micromati]
EKTQATIFNNDTQEVRKEVIEPLTNYNMIVLDQRFNHNSSVSFVNANTTRNGNFRDANASAIVYDLNTKENTYNLYGDFKFTQVNTIKDYNGIKTAVNFEKTSGRYRYLFAGKYISENYDINDLGIVFYTNYHNVEANVSYRILNPTKIFNTLKIEQEVNLELQNTTGKVQESWYKTVVKARSLKNDYYELGIIVNPLETFDFYEPREYGRYVYIPKRVASYFGFELNRNNELTLDMTVNFTKFDEEKRLTHGFYASPKYRFNDKFSLAYAVEYTNMRNDRGWVDFDDSGIVFAERNREILQNDLTGKYAVNNRMTINLKARYYWSYSKNHEFFTLQNNGFLTENAVYALNKDRNFNSWNFDLSYSWWFAPGSEVSVLYRSYGLQRASMVEKDLSRNLKNIFNSDLTNVLSISVRYFIDYNAIKNKF